MDALVRESLSAAFVTDRRTSELRQFYRRVEIVRTIAGTADDLISIKACVSQDELDLFRHPGTESHSVALGVAPFGFRAATRQWLCPEEATWCTLQEYHLIGMLRSESQPGASIDPWYNVPQPFMAAVTRKVRIQASNDGNLKAVVVQVASVPDPSAFLRVEPTQKAASSLDDAFTARFEKEMRELDRLYQPVRSGRDGKQRFLLQIYHAHLNLFAAFLGVFAISYLAPRTRVLNGSSGKQHPSRWNMDELRDDAVFLQHLKCVGAEMRATLESILEVVLATEKDPEVSAIISAEIHGSIREAWTHLEQMSEEINNKTQILSTARDLRQSDNIRRLTILATVFLPLSLSAGLLSMQTRFLDLGVLLYDFFGVFVFSATVAALFLGILQYIRNQTYSASGRVYDHYAKLVLLFLACYSVVTFGIGMFCDVGAGLIGLGLAVVMALYTVTTWAVLRYWRLLG